MRLSIKSVRQWLRAVKPRGLLRSSLLVYAILGLCLYVLFLASSIPATWLSWSMTKFSHGSVAITQASGTIWDGKGHIIINYPNSKPHDLGLTRWDIYPLWLLTGRLQFTLEGMDKTAQGKITIRQSLNKTELIDSRISIPAAFISELYSPAALLSPTGRILLTADSFMYEEKMIKGDVTVQWLEAGSTLSPVRPLGNYRLALSGKGDALDIKLETLEGDLELAGQGKWSASTNGVISFNGTARPRNRASELEPLLALMGRDLGGGRRLLNFSQRISAGPFRAVSPKP
ncbi:MAG: type II secretion system protein N [Gammaproteobacteria bacterium]|nr:type II secretion system protein N [Gammaproteobacteria bacterium]